MAQSHDGLDGDRAASAAGLDLTVATQGPLTTMSLGGEIDILAIPELERAVRHLDLRSATTLLLDMTAVTFADSSAMAWLVRTHERTVASSCAFLVVIPRDGEVDRVVRLTKIDDVIAVERDAHGVASAGPMRQSQALLMEATVDEVNPSAGA